MRSTKAPIGSENNSHGKAAATPMNEIANSLRVSRVASNGSATMNTPSPRLEIVLAVHKRQKARGSRAVTSLELTVGPLRPGCDAISECLFRMCGDLTPLRWAIRGGGPCRSMSSASVSTRRTSFGAMNAGNESATMVAESTRASVVRPGRGHDPGDDRVVPTRRRARRQPQPRRHRDGRRARPPPLPATRSRHR